jgi:hypothetical protein
MQLLIASGGEEITEKVVNFKDLEARIIVTNIKYCSL